MLKKHMNGDDFQTQCHHTTQLYRKLRHYHVVKAGTRVKVRNIIETLTDAFIYQIWFFISW